MTTLAETISNGLNSALPAIVETAKLDPAKAKAAIDELAKQQAEVAARQVTLELDATREKILLAELAQGDNFTKRARPTVVYAGVLFIFVLHVLLPLLVFVTKGTMPAKDSLPLLPEEFWLAWSGVVSIWVLGRSYEKVNAPTKLSEAITGSTRKL